MLDFVYSSNDFQDEVWFELEVKRRLAVAARKLHVSASTPATPPLSELPTYEESVAQSQISALPILPTPSRETRLRATGFNKRTRAATGTTEGDEGLISSSQIKIQFFVNNN